MMDQSINFYKKAAALLEHRVNHESFPRFLYKYCPPTEYLIKNLEESTLFLATVKSFNDPFDGSHFLREDYTNKEIVDYYQANYGQGYTRNDLVKFGRKKILEMVDSMLTVFANKAGIFCMTSKKNNLLMWAHYAQKHEGVCLEFDVLKSKEVFGPTYKMEYRDEYPFLDYFQSEDGRDLFKRTVLHKSKEWKYEEEYRLLYHDRNGPIKFNKNALTGVYLGFCCKIKDEVIQIVKENYGENTKIYQAVKSKRKYEVEFEEILS